MFIKRFAALVLSLLVTLVGILVACAVPTPTLTPTSTPTSTMTGRPTVTGALAQIVAGAKKEGTVLLLLRTGFTPKSMERLKREIKDMFGVDLDIKFSPTSSMPKELADTLMEYQVGATPSYDLMTFTAQHILPAIDAGVLEKVDWEPLLLEGTPRAVINGSAPPDTQKLYGYALTYYTGRKGLMYNPEKVRADELPQTLSDLADPKWRGKVAIPNYPGGWTRMAFVIGKEKLLADLRAILRNGAILGTYANEHNRFLLGEVWMCYISSAYLKEAWDKGVQAGWYGIEPVDVEIFSAVVRKNAAHPNAAKLVAVYLASPEGAKFTLEESGSGNLYYPGNYEYDVDQQETKQKIYHISASSPEIVAFIASEDFDKWQNEVNLVLKGG